MAYLLGIDVGSTSCKAAAYDHQGQLLAVGSRPTLTRYLENSWAEIDPDGLWCAVAGCIKDVVEQLDGSHCDGLAIASMCGTAVLLDKEDQCVYPMIAWFDTRTADIADKWRSDFGAENVFQITGINPNSVAGITKAQWIKQNYPERFSRVTRWFQVQDFINYKLTAQAVVDYSVACRSMTFNLNTLTWSDDILQAAGLNRELLPRPVIAGTLVGKITHQVEKITGLQAGTPVFAGGIDYVCGALATGIVDTGQTLNSTGTSEQVLVITDRPAVNPENFKENFTCVTHVVKDKYYMMGMIVSSGAIMEWFKQQLCNCSFDELMLEAAERPLGANGVMLLPHFRGRYSPGEDASSRGAFVGLTTAATRGDLVRAILEGLCYEMATNIDGIRNASKTDIHSIHAIGGATNSDFWIQMKADITGVTVKSKTVRQAATLGAAMLAGIGSGVYADTAAAVAAVQHPEKIYVPNPDNYKKYRQLYEVLYRNVYPTLAKLNHEITDIQYKLNKER